MFIKALAIFVIGKFIAGLLRKVIDRIMKRNSVDDMLRKFLCNMIYAFLMTFVIIAGISMPYPQRDVRVFKHDEDS